MGWDQRYGYGYAMHMLMDRCIRVVHSAIWSLSLTDFVRWE